MIVRQLPLSLLLTSGLLAASACGGDDGDGTGNDTDASTGDPTTGPSTMTVDPTMTDPTLDPDTTVDPSDPTDPTGDTTEDPTAETTMDPDTSSTGEPVACAGMSFSTLTSTDNDLVTNLTVEGIVSCDLDISITATGGTICAVDDGAGNYLYTVETITLEDVPPLQCGLLAMVGLSNLSIANLGDGTEVLVPQAGGAAVGNQPIVVLGDVEGTAIGMPIGPTPLADFSGVLPEGVVAFGADDTTVTYADTSTLVATATPEVSGQEVTVTLTGLTGSLTYGP